MYVNRIELLNQIWLRVGLLHNTEANELRKQELKEVLDLIGDLLNLMKEQNSGELPTGKWDEIQDRVIGLGIKELVEAIIDWVQQI